MASIPEALTVAVQHHQAGRLQAAEYIYRQILAVEPNQPDALHLLGLIALHVGKAEVAVEYIGRAISSNGTEGVFHSNLGNAFQGLGKLDEAMASYQRALELKPDYAEAHFNLGNAFQSYANLDEAVACYRRALKFKPDFAEAHFNLGNAFQGQGKLVEAIACYRRAVELKPDYAQVHVSLGNALLAQGKPDEATACYRRALELEPDLAEAFDNLGSALADQGKLNEAIACHRRALELKPDYAEAHFNLGNAFQGQGKLGEAMAAYGRALELMPDHAQAHANLGNTLLAEGRLGEAVGYYHLALELKPDYAEAHNNLGCALKDQGKLDEAIASHRRALELKPDYAEAQNNLGNALKSQGKPDEAAAAYRQALQLKPDYAEAHFNLGNVFQGQGKLDKAIACYRRALELKPDFHAAYSNIVYTLNFCSGCDAATIYEEHQRWNQRFAEPLAKFIQPHANERSIDRRLRVGYVSPDFCDHVVGLNLLPLFRGHDRRQFEIVCYAQVRLRDTMTDHFEASADAWLNIVGLSDEALAQRIRDDRIDILVDLALHTSGNRLLVFARKPAPVQVTFTGYPGTTGMTTIDYRLTDVYLDPPGHYDHHYSEESVRLPDSFWCYDPLCSEPEVNPLPALQGGYITFGCLNNFYKINAPTLKLWARVLKAIDHSRIMFLAPEGSHRQRTLDLLEQEGVAPDRVTFVVRQPRPKYLELYHRIDIGLDTLPYNGHTTSLDCFWMGVPVITLVGKTVVGRAGVCQLMNLGLPELIAYDPHQFVRIAVELAGDLSRLSKLRATLRDRMQSSPLMDSQRFARNVEAAYRNMWQRWCDS